MSIYLIDTNVFRALGHYFPSRFPGIWDSIDELLITNRFLSVREVFNEIEKQGAHEHILDWCKNHKSIFLRATAEEANFTTEIFKVKHFRNLVKRQNLLRGQPVADPFLISAAKIKGGTVVTEESNKKNAARIPNVCEHFKIPCINLEEMMNSEGWKF